MYHLDKKAGNTGSSGRYFWRIEDTDGTGAQEKCLTWAFLNKKENIRYGSLIKSDSQMACPCSFWQAWFDRGRFSWSWRYSWPKLCFESRRSIFLSGLQLRQECCYSTNREDWGSLKLGPPAAVMWKLQLSLTGPIAWKRSPRTRRPINIAVLTFLRAICFTVIVRLIAVPFTDLHPDVRFAVFCTMLSLKINKMSCHACHLKSHDVAWCHAITAPYLLVQSKTGEIGLPRTS